LVLLELKNYYISLLEHTLISTITYQIDLED